MSAKPENVSTVDSQPPKIPALDKLDNNNDDSTVHADEEDVDRGIIVRAGDMPPEGFPLAAKKKKKKTRKPASKRGLGKPTGFEEYHADGPLTPDQVLETREAFHPDVPFVDRILKAIQRFERTRKLSPERRDIFYKYLAYGGIDVGPNMFMGAQDVNEMDKDSITSTLAQTSITEDTKQSILDPKQTEIEKESTGDAPESGSRLRSAQHLAKYIVDFEGTMRGFLSRHAPGIYLFDTEANVSIVTTTLERFMDFLLQREVCPEYTTEVLRTRNLCRTARTELWHCAEAQRNFPGDFNIACSTLFGGSYARNYDGETAWASETKQDDTFVGLKPEQATQIVGFAIAGAASEDVYNNYLTITTDDSGSRDFEVISTITAHGFEIIKLEPPRKECLSLYRENTTDFRPVGRVYAKFFTNPTAPPEDLTPEEQALLTSSKAQYKDEYHDEHDPDVFFIEAKPLFSLLRPGMRVEATVYQLNCGVWFFDEVIRVLPSFDLWLENELMLGWKDPKPVDGFADGMWNVGGAVAMAKGGENVSGAAAVQEDSALPDRESSHSVVKDVAGTLNINQSDINADAWDAGISQDDEQNTKSELTYIDTDENETPY